MMNKILIPLLLVLFLGACKNNKHKNSEERFVRVYENALRMGEVNVAINACYEIIANDSTKTNYYDTLVYLYLNTQNQISTYLAAKESLKYNPDNDKMLRVAAEYAKNLQMPDTAMFYYKKTYVINNKLENLYDVAQIQYNMGNYAGAEETADLIIKNPNSEKEKVTIAFDKENPQSVPIKAAAFNVKGTIFIQMENKEIALRYFNEALAVYPDFKLAQRNKEEILNGAIKFKK